MNCTRKTTNDTQETQINLQETSDYQRRNKNFNNKIPEIKNFKTSEIMDKGTLNYNISANSNYSSYAKNRRVNLTKDSEISRTFSIDVNNNGVSLLDHIGKTDRNN